MDKKKDNLYLNLRVVMPRELDKGDWNARVMGYLALQGITYLGSSERSFPSHEDEGWRERVWEKLKDLPAIQEMVGDNTPFEKVTDGVGREILLDFIEKEKEISFNQGYESKMSKYHKEYYKKNKEKMNQRSREYYQKNKALLKLKKWQKANKLSGK